MVGPDTVLQHILNSKKAIYHLNSNNMLQASSQNISSLSISLSEKENGETPLKCRKDSVPKHMGADMSKTPSSLTQQFTGEALIIILVGSV